ncbi:MAG: T9SS type A sorting domain-containing protein [Ignavibacteriae bacterium]|nr:T9SS type A sorting domain-containing protein [Ignavibacteriota bacterium]
MNFKFSCDTCGFVFNKDSAYYFMCFREENKIIYFVPQQNGFGDPDGTEYPVFNFNLSSAGETILAYEFLFLPFGASSDPTPTPGCGVMHDTITLTVESIDNVMMSDGSLRRRINFEPLYYGLKESWIEGIGSTKGFGLSLNVTNSNNTMVCFSHNGVNLESGEILSQQLCTLHPDSTLTFKDRCEYTSASAVDDKEIDNNVTVLPNPVNDNFKITGLNPGDKVTIYNLLGQVIYEERSKSNELVIDKFEFNQGIYIYTINSLNNDIRIGKVVKQ